MMIGVQRIMKYQFYETNQFIFICTFLLIVLVIFLIFIDVSPKFIGATALGGFAAIVAPRLRAQQRFKETVELDATGQTMLFNAYLLEDAQKYIDQGTDVNAADMKGQTPLHVQVDMDHPEIVDLLIRKQAIVNITDEQGRTPLFFAKSIQTAQLLINANAELNVKNNNGESILEYIVKEREKLSPEPSKDKVRASYDALINYLRSIGAE